MKPYPHLMAVQTATANEITVFINGIPDYKVSQAHGDRKIYRQYYGRQADLRLTVGRKNPTDAEDSLQALEKWTAAYEMRR